MISICMLALIASSSPFAREARWSRIVLAVHLPICWRSEYWTTGGRQLMDRWLGAALDYIPHWLEFQMRQSEQPGCVIAAAQRGRIVLERAFGHADLIAGTTLTPRHRFRVASHSKTFTASGIMRLREQGKLRLDDPVGQYLGDLHKAVARVTIAQLLSHSAGLMR